MGWLVFLAQGLPIGDPDDWDHILISQDAPSSVMARNFFVPWSARRNLVAQTDLIDQTVGSRLFHGIALKAVTSIFGYHSFPYYFFNKVIFFAGTIALLFLLLLRLTNSLTLSAIATIFYALVPSHYAHVLWNSVPETMVHFFIMVCLFSYARLADILNTKNTPREFWLWLSLLFVAGWIGMKTKETAIILPMVLGVHACICFPKWRTRLLPYLTLLITVCFLGFLAIPVEHFNLSAKADLGRVFHWETLFRMVFRNFDCGYENEPISAFFSREHIFPVSIARTIGFYSLWTLLLFMLLYVLKRLNARRTIPVLFLKDLLVALAVIWIALEFFLIGFFQPDPRYFSGTMIPITLVLARLVSVVLGASSGTLKKLLAGLAVFAAFHTIYMNFQHTVWLRQQIGQRSHRFYHMAETIFKDYFPEKTPTRRDIGLYYCPMYEPSGSPRLKEVTYFVILDYQALNKTTSPSLADFEQQAAKGFVYYMTDRPDMLLNRPNIRMVKKLSGINEESLFERLLYRLKKKKPGPYYIFRLMRPDSPHYET